MKKGGAAARRRRHSLLLLLRQGRASCNVVAGAKMASFPIVAVLVGSTISPEVRLMRRCGAAAVAVVNKRCHSSSKKSGRASRGGRRHAGGAEPPRPCTRRRAGRSAHFS